MKKKNNNNENLFFVLKAWLIKNNNNASPWRDRDVYRRNCMLEKIKTIRVTTRFYFNGRPRDSIKLLIIVHILL